MDFKKKAGLALALAAIFTVNGANLALADNVTGVTPGPAGSGSLDSTKNADNEGRNVINTAVLKPNSSGALSLTGTGGTVELVTSPGAAANLQFDSPDGSSNTVKDLVLDGNINLTIAGDGGNLISSNGNPLTSLDTGGGDITVGDATDATKSAASGGSLTTVDMGGGDLLQIGGTLTVQNLTLGGGQLTVDPMWVDGDDKDIESGKAAVLEFSGANKDIIDGTILVGRNSEGAVGTDDISWLASVTYDAGREFDGTLKDVNKAFAWTSNEGATGLTAAFGVFSPMQLDDTDGGIEVDGIVGSTHAVDPNSLIFADQSLFVVNVGNLDGKAALSSNVPTSGTGGGVFDLILGGDYITSAAHTSDTTATDLGNSIYLFNGANGGTYTLIDDVSTISIGYGGGADLTLGGPLATDDLEFKDALANAGSNKYWQIQTGSPLLKGTLSLGNATAGAGEGYSIIANITRDTNVHVSDVYPMLSNGIADMVEQLYDADWQSDYARNVYSDENRAFTGDSDQAGIAFVSRVTDTWFMDNHEEAASILEGAAQIAVAAGVPAVTNNAITKISSLIVDHNNLLNETQPAYGNEPGSFGIWANPFYVQSDVDGMDAGRFESGYEMNYGGAAFGIDYNINEAFRLGLALNVGGGDTESEGDFNKTEADFDFFGVSLYGSYTNGAFGLTGDLGFTGVDSDIDQNVPASIGMGNLKSEVDSDAFTIGLTGQYRFAASDNFNITPHLGLRYTKISVDDANVDSRYGRVFNVTTEDQNLFQIPVGVEFSSNIVTDGGWTVTPSADLGVLFNAGDSDIESSATIAGTGFGGRTSTDVTDSAAFQGRLGIKAAADNGLSLGLDYGILASGNQTDHQFSGMLRFEF